MPLTFGAAGWIIFTIPILCCPESLWSRFFAGQIDTAPLVAVLFYIAGVVFSLSYWLIAG